MKATVSALSLATLLVFPARCAIAQPAPSFDKFAQTAETAGTNQAVALDNWTKAVAVAEKSSNTGGQLALAFALVHLGDSYRKDLEKSVATYKRGVEIRDKVGASQTLGMVRNLLRYGMMQQAINTQMEMKAIELSQKELDNKHEDKAEEIKAKEKQEEIDVRPSLSRALEIARGCSAPEAIQFQIMQCLSSAYYGAKQFDEAEKLDLKMIEWADKPNNVNARSERMAGYGNLSLIYDDTHKPTEHVMAKLTEASDDVPDAAKIKAIQDLYGAAEKVVDESEKHAYKAAMTKSGPVHK